MLKLLQEIISEIFDKDAIKNLKSKRLRALVQFKPKQTNKKKKVIKDEEEVENSSIFPDYRPII